MTIILAIIFGLLGLAIGSFLNVCIDRLPARKSLAFPASHCDACLHPLSMLDNIPVFSYLWIRGRCRYCGAHIPVRVVLVELTTGLMFALLFFNFGLTAEYAVVTIYTCILLVLSVIDLEHGLLLNVIVYPAMILAFAINLFVPEVVLNGYPPDTGVLNGLLGGAIGFVLLLVPAVLSRSGMGWGDVKMAGMLGLMTGFPNVFVAILSGIILGGLWAAGLIISGKKKRKEAIPFGPFLALGGLFSLVWGTTLVQWYLGFF